MSASSVGTPTWTAISGSGTISPAWGTGQTHASGDTGVVIVEGFNNSTNPVTFPAAPTGWTQRESQTKTNGVRVIRAAIYDRLLDGTATDNFSFSVTNTGKTQAIAIQLTGMATSVTVDTGVNGTGVFTFGQSTATGTLAVTGGTTTNANDVIVSGVILAGSSPTWTWTSPMVDVLQTTSTTSATYDSALAFVSSTGTYTPQGTAGGTSALDNIVIAVAYQQAGGSNATVSGAVAGLTVAAPAGVIGVTAVGAVTNVAIAAPAGIVTTTVVGAKASLTLAAPAGAIVASSNVSGAVSNVALAAPAGSIAATTPVAGAVSNIAISAPAGTVIGSAVVTGAISSVTVAAPAGTVKTTVVGSTVNVALAAPAGTVTTTVVGLASNIAVAAPAGTINATTPVAGAVSGITLAAPAGSVSAVTIVAGPTCGVTFAAPAGAAIASNVVIVPGVTTGLVVGAAAGSILVVAYRDLTLSSTVGSDRWSSSVQDGERFSSRVDPGRWSSAAANAERFSSAVGSDRWSTSTQES